MGHFYPNLILGILAKESFEILEGVREGKKDVLGKNPGWRKSAL